MKKQMICVDCEHPKGQHANDGCNHYKKNYTKCSCQNKRTSEYFKRYQMGEPIDD